MIRVECAYYAMMRERSGCASESIQTEATTPQELYEQVVSVHGFSAERSHVKVAINDAFATWETPLQDGDRIAFIPPVSGGCGLV